MKDELFDFKTAFVNLIDDARAEDEEHPETELLLDYRRGKLPEAEARRVQEHLLTCRECLETWRSPKQESPTEPVADFELAAFWRGLKRQMAHPDSPWSGRKAPRPGPRGIPRTLAAALVVGLLGLSVWAALQQRALQTQKQTIAELSLPSANVPVVDLVAPTSDRGGAGAPTLEIAAERGAALVLTPVAELKPTAYQLVIVADDGTEVAIVRDLVRRPQDDTFSVWLPPGFLPPGEYLFALEEVPGDGEERRIESYRLRVVPPGAASLP